MELAEKTPFPEVLPGPRAARRPLRVVAVVPAFNEVESIASVLADLSRSIVPLDVVVINDCSKDGTSAAARAGGLAEVIDLPCNLGIGGAVQAGLKYAARHGYDVAIQFDGDGQHLISEIPALIAPILDGQADLVVGSRFVAQAGGNFRSTLPRRLGIGLLSGLSRLLTGSRVLDMTSGFRAYGPLAIRALVKEYPADFPEPETVAMLSLRGQRIAEVPARMRERQGGTSSISGIKSFYYMVKVAFCLFIVRLRGRSARDT